MNRITRTVFFVGVPLWLLQLSGQELVPPTMSEVKTVSFEEINKGIPRFHGLAAYYNQVLSYLVTDESLIAVNEDEQVTLQQKQNFVSLGRKRALVVKGEGAIIKIVDDSIEIRPSVVKGLIRPTYYLERSELSMINPELEHLRYSGLWAPFEKLARAVEWILHTIQNRLVTNWGLSIIALAVVLKIILLPLSLLTLKSQRKVARFQSLLEPKLVEIKVNYRGEDAHNRIMAAHKELGISHIYTLKPLLFTLIQIPVLIAVFNALGEMPQLMGHSFLWIEDLSLPDSLAELPFSVPLLGSTLNLLPIIMTIVSVAAALLFQNRSASIGEIRKQKRNLLLMSLAFLILFYPFPASMVLYWTASNALHIVQQRVLG